MKTMGCCHILPQGLKFKRLTITTAGEDAGADLSYVADGTQNV